MKKIMLTIIAALAFSTQGMAQKFIDVYQNGKVALSRSSADIDSISITGSDTSSRQVHFWSAGTARSFATSEVDSVSVFRYEDNPLVFLGVLGFNQELYTKPIDILSSSTASLYNSFISSLPCKDGTLLYYGVDEALNMLTEYNFNSPLSSVNLITFTDGLDQGSMMMTTEFEEESEYLASLSQRISTTTVRGLPLTAYSLGLHGTDVTNYTQFQNNLRQLATSADKAYEVNSMSDVMTRLQEIADQIISVSNTQTISMTIPGQSNGTQVCFTFDGRSPGSSTMYIKGTFNLTDRSLRDVTYYGLRSTSGSTVAGVQEGVFVTYTFTGLQRTDGNGLIPTSNIKQYNLTKNSETWQVNSEFTPDNIQTTITHSGAAIMLVLDCSSSLGSEFSNMQSYAKNFISRVAENAANFTMNAPSNVTAELDDEGMVVVVSWDAVKYAESYSVYRLSPSSTSFTKIAEGVTTTTWLDESPLQGANYYRIYATGHGLTSSASSTSRWMGVPMPVTAVDLGLPSGTKWANMNVGASIPEDYGDYFAWGETTPKSEYNWSTYKWCNGSYDTLTKYCNDSDCGYNGFTDNKTVLDAEDDAATANWGGDWRMPTRADFDELLTNTTSEWTTQNGVYGRKFTSMTNGNSIFLPAAGYRWNGELYHAGSDGNYWSSTLNESYPGDARYLNFGSGHVYAGNYRRRSGRSVRPVRQN